MAKYACASDCVHAHCIYALPHEKYKSLLIFKSLAEAGFDQCIHPRGRDYGVSDHGEYVHGDHARGGRACNYLTQLLRVCGAHASIHYVLRWGRYGGYQEW